MRLASAYGRTEARHHLVPPSRSPQVTVGQVGLEIDRSWVASAACDGLDTNALFFSDRPVKQETRKMCAGCPVKDACLEYIMEVEGDADRKHRFGFQGGLTSEERFQLYRISIGRPATPKHKVIEDALVQQWMSARVGLYSHGYYLGHHR